MSKKKKTKKKAKEAIEEIKIPGPQIGYTDLLDHKTTEHLKEKQKQANKYFPLRPSSAGQCARKLAYDLMEYRGFEKYSKTIFQPNVHRLLNLGHSIEYSAIQNFKLIDELQVRYKQQSVTLFKLEDVDGNAGELIEGQVDLVFYSESTRCLMDIKSMKDAFSVAYKTRFDETLDKFSKLKSIKQISATAFYIHNLKAFRNEANDAFLMDNIYQLNSYAHSSFMQQRKIDHCSIYKYNKNDSRHYELRFSPSQEFFEEIREKYNRVNKAVWNKDPLSVRRDYVLGSMRCAFCNYAKTCWETDTKREWFQTLPPKQWPTDVSKLDLPKRGYLEKMFSFWEELETLGKKKSKLEELIIKFFEQEKLRRIKLEDGRIYKLNHTKTYGLQIKRDKL